MQGFEDKAGDSESARLLCQYAMAERLANIGHWSWQLNAEYVEWSPETYRIHGVDPETFETTLDNAIAAYLPGERERVARILSQSIAENVGFDFSASISQPSGEIRHMRLLGEPETDFAGDMIGLFGVAMDVTERLANERALAQAIQRQEDFADVSSDWLWEMGPDLRFTYFSPNVELVTGVPAEFHIGKTREELLAGREMTPEMLAHQEILKKRLPFRNYSYWREGHDGRRQYLSTSGKPYYDEDGAFAGYRGSGRDMSAEQESRDAMMQSLKRLGEATRAKSEALRRLEQANTLAEKRNSDLLVAQQAIRHSALHDPLTGLANRRYLDETLRAFAQDCLGGRQNLAALHIDLDRFKQINDTMGHAAGDAILCHVAGVLKRMVRAFDFVARVGGDEFVILCKCDGNPRILTLVAQRIINELSKPFVFDGRECHFGASIGIAIADGEQVDEEALLVNADIALYRAKNDGRGRAEFFSEQVQAEIVRYKKAADGVIVGLRNDEFQPFYHPQFCARTLELVGVEALARWHHPERGVLEPSEFLRVAEDLKAVERIDRQILEHALADLDRWRRHGVDIPKLSVNVSASRLLGSDLIAGLKTMNLPQGRLAFELLESIFLDDFSEEISWNLDMIKEMGIKVELDDFGSGHASIVSLIRIRPDAIKIDRELIQPIAEDPGRSDLVRSIIEIGHSLKAAVTAEGVESMEQAHILGEMNCDVLQGFCFSEPIRPDALPGFLADWEQRRASLQVPALPDRLAAGSTG